MYYPDRPVAINLITSNLIRKNVKAKPDTVYYAVDTNEVYIFTADEKWVKSINNIAPEVQAKRYTNKQFKCPSCGAPHKETEEKCSWCGNYFVSEDYI